MRRQSRDVLALASAEPGWPSGRRVFERPLGPRGRRDRDVAARVAQHPLQQGLRPRGDAELPERFESLMRRRRRSSAPSANGRMTTTPRPRSAASGRIRSSTSRSCGLYGICTAAMRPVRITRLELTERGCAVVRRADGADQTSCVQSLERVQMRAPGAEVVDLIEIDAPAVERQRVVNLAPAFVGRRGPDLGCDNGRAAVGPQCTGQHGFRAAIHGRRVETSHATRQRGGHDAPALGFRCRAGDVECSPRAHADHGHAQSRRAQGALVQGVRTQRSSGSSRRPGRFFSSPTGAARP